MLKKYGRILFIGAPFFGYYKKIINEFINIGYTVDYYNDRPSDASIVKGIIKLKKSILAKNIEKYFDKIIDETKNKKYDIVLVLNCKVFSDIMINRLKNYHNESKFVLYMWDSLTLYPETKKVIHLFDKVYSFDLDDCKTIKTIKFLPLFYIHEYKNLEKKDRYEYDICSICTAHPNRYELIQKLFHSLEKNDIKIFSYMYLDKLQYIYNKLFINQFKHSKFKEFKFTSLSIDETLDVISKSKVIFDIPHSKQSGLTMRTIEALGARKKLITTNRDILEYDFYNEKNIFLLDINNINNIENIVDFINSDYIELKNTLYSKYSISEWINVIVEDKENNYLK